MTDAPGTDERRLATGAGAVLALLALPLGAVGGLVAGWPGMASALIGLAFVLLLFGGSAAMLAWAVARGRRALAVLVGGVVLRLVVYAAALVGLAQVPWVHRPSLAVATAVAIAVTLAHELRLLSQMPRLFWVDADTPAATRPRRDTELMHT